MAHTYLSLEGFIIDMTDVNQVDVEEFQFKFIDFLEEHNWGFIGITQPIKEDDDEYEGED